MRDLFGQLSDSELALAFRAVQVVRWERENRFCGRCGAPMVTQPDEHGKRCPSCGLLRFPTLCPAVIVAVVTRRSCARSNMAT